MNMNVLANLKFQGSSPILEHLTEFPETPQDGQMALIGGVVYMYTTLRGMSTWYPLTNEKNYFVQTQGQASTTWTVNHNLSTSDFVFFTYDENNNLLQADYEYVNDDSFKLNYTVARKGKVVIFYAVDSLNVDKSYGIKKLNYVAAQDQSVFTITDSLFVFDYIDVYVNGLKLNDSEYSHTTEELTLNTPLNVDDYVSVTTYGQVDFREIGVRKEEYTAVQDQTVFNIVHLEGQVDAFVNGIILKTTEFTDDANTVTIGSPLNDGDEVILKVYDTVNSLDNYTQIEVDQKVNTDDIVDALDTTYTAKPLSANMGRVLEETKVSITDIDDSLVSTATNVTLSANQGRVLKGLLDNINVLLTTDDTTLDDLQEVVTYIKANKTDLENLAINNIAGLATALSDLQSDIDLKVTTTDINNTLTSTSITVPLSANQGKVLNDTKIGAADYATPTVGGTVKLRRDGDTLYITTDGSNA